MSVLSATPGLGSRERVVAALTTWPLLALRTTELRPLESRECLLLGLLRV